MGQRFGSYELTRLIGEGGLAIVYLGRHVYLNTLAAIKVLRLHVSQKNLDNFLAEAQTVAQLRHPHIVRIFDFGVEQGAPFLAMDYAANGTLRQRHPSGQTIRLSTVVSYTKQAAKALQYAHNRGIIHRDVKPENMLLGDNSEVLLSDFGIALQTEYDPHNPYQHTIVSGTPSYMAPEQLLGEPCAASDQYALGIVVYEWLCGSRPFTGSFTSIIDQHLKQPPPHPRDKNPQLSRNVENVVLKALAKNPQERYPGVKEFAAALERVHLQDSTGGGTSPAYAAPHSDLWRNFVEVLARLIRDLRRQLE